VEEIFKAKSDRTKMEEEPTMLVPDPEKEQQDFIIEQKQEVSDSSDKSEYSESSENSKYSDNSENSESSKSSDFSDDFDLSDITHKEKSREDIIAEAEAAAFAEA
jgi:ribonuclease-3